MRDRLYPQKLNLRFHKLRLGRNSSRACCCQPVGLTATARSPACGWPFSMRHALPRQRYYHALPPSWSNQIHDSKRTVCKSTMISVHSKHLARLP